MDNNESNSIENAMRETNNKTDCYFFDSKNLYKIFKSACNVKKKRFVKKGETVYSWLDFSNAVSEWFNKVPKEERENAKHYIINRRKNAEIGEKNFETATLLFSLCGSIVLSLAILISQRGINLWDKKVEEIDTNYRNTLVIDFDDYFNLDKDLKEKLDEAGCNYNIREVETPRIFIDYKGPKAEIYKNLESDMLKNNIVIDDFAKITDVEKEKEESFIGSLIMGTTLCLTFYAALCTTCIDLGRKRRLKNMYFYDSILEII